MASHKKITNPERSLSESAVIETRILIISNNINSSSNAKLEKNRNNNDNDLDDSKVANEVAIYGSLCNFGDLPNWCQDNSDIVSGYRKPTFSYLKCAYSLFYIHNESSFFCNEYLKIIYLSFITILGIATTFLAVSPKFRHPQFRWFRTSLFLSLGLSAVIPLTHAVILYGGSSHQIFHLFVVAAALVHYHGVVQSMIYWHKENYECTLDIESMKFK
ncbi:26291_t:CDS:2 [Gigaspora rosea]|nr:26291_t:CDS:2 [Gigaspora rosea]